MTYINRNDALEIIERIQNFESDLKNVFDKYGYNLHENLGRRNQLVSNAQEKETRNVLAKKFDEVISDGTPGNPDVVIVDINKELECKLTSGSRSKGSVSYSFQTDWDTINNKKVLDYIYVVASDDFKRFCVLFFEGLTPDDFFPPAKGSRGKSRMNKANAMKKVTVLVGDVINLREEWIQRYQDEIILLIEERNDKQLDCKNFESYLKIEEAYAKKIEKTKNKLEKWIKKTDSFSLEFEEVKAEHQYTLKYDCDDSNTYHLFVNDNNVA